MKRLLTILRAAVRAMPTARAFVLRTAPEVAAFQASIAIAVGP